MTAYMIEKVWGRVFSFTGPFPRRARVAMLLALALFVGGCSRMTVPVPVWRPAEIDLGRRNAILVKPFTGRGGATVETYVMELLKEARTINLVAAEHREAVLRELMLSNSDLAGPGPRNKLGRLTAATVILTGRALDYRYDEYVESYAKTCVRKVKREGKWIEEEYTCYEYERNGSAVVRVAFQLIDVESGEVVLSRNLRASRRETTESEDGPPAWIDGDGMLDDCARETARDFVKIISPWQDVIRASFYRDDSLPMMETGIEYARGGQWDLAVGEFVRAVNIASTDPGIKIKAAGKAHWNLGLAYEYTERYDQAIEQIQKAHALTGDEDYLREVAHVERLKREQAELKRQLENSGNSIDD